MEIFEREKIENTFDLTQISVGLNDDPTKRITVKSLKLNVPPMAFKNAKRERSLIMITINIPKIM